MKSGLESVVLGVFIKLQRAHVASAAYLLTYLLTYLRRWQVRVVGLPPGGSTTLISRR